MSLPAPRGELSAAVLEAFAGSEPPPEPVVDDDPRYGEDFHLALYLCYELHYRSFEGVDDRLEWDPRLLRFRASLESRFEHALLDDVEIPATPKDLDVGDALRALVEADDGPSLSRHLESRAPLEQFREFVIHRSAYQLKEADPHSWAIPRISGAPKAALVEIQADEYGGGDPERMHSALFAGTMRALDLDPAYGAYLDLLPATTLATVNLMSLFGLHRRLRGAIVGHLAAFEMTSPIPNRRYANGLRRLGFGDEAIAFYDEHVEADSAHENIAAYDLAGRLARDEPGLARQILFGAAALLLLEQRFADSLLGSWEVGESSLLRAPAATPLA